MTSLRRAGLLWTLALGGCASFDAHSLDRAAGWHAAQVVAVGRADALGRSADRDCGGSGAEAYVVVRYRNGGVHSRSLGTSRLPPGVPLSVGDAVYVNLPECKVTLALPAEVSRTPR
jgi:hypothetical protein